MTKEKLMEALEGLPEEFNIDELVERLRFMEAVEEGFRQIDEGKTKTQEEVEEMIKSWRQ